MEGKFVTSLLLLALLGTASAGTCTKSKTAVSAVADQDEIVNAHNVARAAEKASNMYALVWDDDLAQKAQDWANGCKWGHGNHVCDVWNGQNMWMGSAGSFSLDSMVKTWIGERAYYDVDTHTCSAPAGKACGHYTQVVWAKTTKVGCGRKTCATVEGISWTNMEMFVCNYLEGGNMQGVNPFAVTSPGKECSGCAFKPEMGLISRCDNGLCSSCKSMDESDDCVCKLSASHCKNGGSADSASCTCKCAEGYKGDLCEVPTVCINNVRYGDSNCDRWDGFCKSHKSFMTKYCPKTCGFC